MNSMMAMAAPAPPMPNRKRSRLRLRIGILSAVSIGTAVVLLVGWRVFTADPTARVARVWLAEYQALRLAGGEQRLPDRPLSLGEQQVLVNLLVQPESGLARAWDRLCRKLPKPVGRWVPRLPEARDRVMTVGSALIELPGTIELRRQLLDAALKPGAANQMFAVQIANGGWPIQPELVPLLEQLSEVEDPHLRLRAASMLRGVAPADARVQRLLARLREDPVSVVREAARPIETDGKKTD